MRSDFNWRDFLFKRKSEIDEDKIIEDFSQETKKMLEDIRKIIDSPDYHPSRFRLPDYGVDFGRPYISCDYTVSIVARGKYHMLVRKEDDEILCLLDDNINSDTLNKMNLLLSTKGIYIKPLRHDTNINNYKCSNSLLTDYIYDIIEREKVEYEEE